MSVGNGERAGMNGLEILGLDSSVVPGEASNTARRRSLKDFAATRGHSFQVCWIRTPLLQIDLTEDT